MKKEIYGIKVIGDQEFICSIENAIDKIKGTSYDYFDFVTKSNIKKIKCSYESEDYSGAYISLFRSCYIHLKYKIDNLAGLLVHEASHGKDIKKNGIIKNVFAFNYNSMILDEERALNKEYSFLKFIGYIPTYTEKKFSLHFTEIRSKLLLDPINMVWRIDLY